VNVDIIDDVATKTSEKKRIEFYYQKQTNKQSLPINETL